MSLLTLQIFVDLDYPGQITLSSLVDKKQTPVCRRDVPALQLADLYKLEIQTSLISDGKNSTQEIANSILLSLYRCSNTTACPSGYYCNNYFCCNSSDIQPTVVLLKPDVIKNVCLKIWLETLG